MVIHKNVLLYNRIFFKPKWCLYYLISDYTEWMSCTHPHTDLRIDFSFLIYSMYKESVVYVPFKMATFWYGVQYIHKMVWNSVDILHQRCDVCYDLVVIEYSFSCQISRTQNDRLYR